MLIIFDINDSNIADERVSVALVRFHKTKQNINIIISDGPGVFSPEILRQPGVLDYFSKPYQSTDLARKVHEALGRSYTVSR